MSQPWIMNLPEEVAVAWGDARFNPDTVCISITEPDRIPPSKFEQFPALRQYLAVLRLQFHDFDPARHTGEGRPRFFEPWQAQVIVAFAKAFRGRNIMVHCAAGISRSGAVVEALLQAFPEYRDNEYSAKRYPNGHVRALMKRALGLQHTNTVDSKAVQSELLPNSAPNCIEGA